MLPPCGDFYLPLDKLVCLDLLLPVTFCSFSFSNPRASSVLARDPSWLSMIPLRGLGCFSWFVCGRTVHLFMTRRRHETKGQHSVFLTHSHDSLAKCMMEIRYSEKLEWDIFFWYLILNDLFIYDKADFYDFVYVFIFAALVLSSGFIYVLPRGIWTRPGICTIQATAAVQLAECKNAPALSSCFSNVLRVTQSQVRLCLNTVNRKSTL